VRRTIFSAAVIDRPTELGGVLDGDLLGSRRRDRQDLHCDARIVHRPEPLLADTHQFLGERFGCHRGGPHLVDEIGGSMCSSRAISVMAILPSWGVAAAQFAAFTDN
jgi:hypothetical protein